MVPLMVGLATCPLFDGDCGGGAEMCFVFVLAGGSGHNNCYPTKYGIMMRMKKVAVDFYTLICLCEDGCIRVKERIK